MFIIFILFYIILPLFNFYIFNYFIFIFIFILSVHGVDKIDSNTSSFVHSSSPSVQGVLQDTYSTVVMLQYPHMWEVDHDRGFLLS